MKCPRNGVEIGIYSKAYGAHDYEVEYNLDQSFHHSNSISIHNNSRLTYSRLRIDSCYKSVISICYFLCKALRGRWDEESVLGLGKRGSCLKPFLIL